MTQPLFFRDEAGKVFEVPADQLETAHRAGLVPAAQKDVDAALKREAAGGAAGQARAFSEGFASGTVDAATAIPRAASAIGAHVAGVADPLADMTGRGALETIAYEAGGGGLAGAGTAQRFAEGSRLAAEENAGSAMAGTIGGQILGAEIGGLGALARGAGGMATKALGAGRAARVAGAGVAGGLEGAPLNIVAAQDEAYIENRKLTGEMAVSAGLHGLLIGGGIGAGVRGIGEAIGAGAGRVAKRFEKPATGDDAVKVAEQKFGEAAPGLREGYARLSGAVSGKDPEAIRALVAGGKEGAAARRIAVFEGDAIREAAKREFVGHVDEMSGATRNLTEEWRGPLKPANVNKVIAKGDEAFVAQSNEAINQLHGIRSNLTEMSNESAAFTLAERRQMRKLADFAGVAETKAAKAIEAGDGVGLFGVMDNYKRGIGTVVKGGGPALGVEMKGMYEGLRQSLENEAVWGGAGAMQREVNAPFAKWLKSNEAFEQRFMTKTGEVDPLDPWRTKMGADPAKSHTYIEGLTSAKNDLDHQLVKQHIANTKELASSLAKAGELTPEKAAELAKVVKATEGFETTVAKAEKSLVASNQLRALDKLDTGSAGHLLGAAGGAVLGGAFADDSRGTGAGVGALIGAVAGGLRSPGLMVRRMAMIERYAEKAGVSIDGSLNKVFAGIEGAGSKFKQAATATRNAVTPTALELFQGSHATPELAYKARAKEVLDADANYGQRIRDNAAHVFGNSFDADPHAVGAAVVATTKAIRLLAEKMPGGLVQTQSLTPMSAKTSPSRIDIQQYAMLHTAVTQPLAVIADISKGTVTRDQIDAIAEVHPALIQHVRMSVLERLQKLDQKGIEVPLRQRIILDSLLDLDGAGELALSSDFAEKYAASMSDTAAAQAEAQAPRPRPGPSKIGERLKTPTDEMIGGV